MTYWDNYASRWGPERARQEQAGRVAQQAARLDALRESLEQQSMEDRIEKLTILVEAMWEILEYRLGVTDYELVMKAREIDLRSGAADGRRAAPKRRCPACDAAVNAGDERCTWCGEAVAGADPFNLQ